MAAKKDRREEIRRTLEARQILESKAAPAADVAGASATGGAGTGQPLRAPMFLQDTVIPSARAAAYAAPIAIADAGATVLGAVPSAISGAASLAGFPQVGEKISELGWDIEGQRAMLGVPQMRAAQDLESAPPAARIAARGLEMATGGAVFTAPLIGGAKLAQAGGAVMPDALKILANNPKAVLKVQAIIDSASGAAGEVAAQVAQALGMDPDTQEAGRAFTSLATAFGGPAAINALRRASTAGKDLFVPKPEQRVKEDVGAELARERLRDPNAMETARQNAAEFQQYGMQPPPIGSTTGNPALMAGQQSAMRNVPGMAKAEQVRQAATDEAIINQLRAATPEGDVAAVSRALRENAVADAAFAEEQRRIMDMELLQEQTNLLRAKESRAALVREMEGELDEVVTRLTAQAEETATAAIGELGQGMSAHEAGDLFVSELRRLREEFRLRSNKAFPSVLQGSREPVDFDAIRGAAVEASIPSNPVLRPEIPTSIQSIVGYEGAAITPSQLHGLRSDLLSEIRTALGKTPADEQAARRLNIVVDAIDKEFERLGTRIPGLAELNKWYREGTIALKGGRWRDVGRNLSRRGGVEIDPSEVAARFLRANTATGADEAVMEFNRAFGGIVGLDPQPNTLPFGVPDIAPSAVANRALDEYIIRDMILSAQDDLNPSRIDGDKLIKWVNRHSYALDRRPDLAKRMRSTAKAQELANEEVARIAKLKEAREKEILQAAKDPADEEMAARIKSKEKEIKEFEAAFRSDAARQQRAFELAIEDPQGRINQIVSSDPATAAHEIRKLKRELGRHAGGRKFKMNMVSSDALAGLNAALWKAFISKFMDPVSGQAAASPIVNPDAFAKMLRDYGDVVMDLFGPERKELLDVMQRLAARNTAGGIPGVSTTNPSRMSKVDQVFSMLQSRVWGVARGVVGVPYVATEAFARAVFGNRSADINRTAAQQLLERALYDPDVYEDLVRAAKFPRNKKITNRLAARLSYGRQAGSMLLDNRKARTRQDIQAIRERQQQEAPQPRAAYNGSRG